MAVHQGAFDSMDQTFAALGTIVAERANGTPADVAEHRTEIWWPIFQTTAGDTREVLPT